MITAIQILIDGVLVYPQPAALLLPKGWTLRPAAKVLGVHWTHLGKVLNGERHSDSLVRRMASLPANPKPTKP